MDLSRKPPPDELAERIELQRQFDRANETLHRAIAPLLQSGVRPMSVLGALGQHAGLLFTVLAKEAPPGWDPAPAIDSWVQLVRDAIANPTGQPVPKRTM